MTGSTATRETPLSFAEHATENFARALKIAGSQTASWASSSPPPINFSPVETEQIFCEIRERPTGVFTVNFSFGFSMLMYRIIRVMVASLNWGGAKRQYDGIGTKEAARIIALIAEHSEGDDSIEGGPHFEMPQELIDLSLAHVANAQLFLFLHEIGHALERSSNSHFVTMQLLSGNFVGTKIPRTSEWSEWTVDMFAMTQLSLALLGEKKELDEQWQARAMSINSFAYEAAIVSQFIAEKISGVTNQKYGSYADRIKYMRIAASKWFPHPDLAGFQVFMGRHLMEIVDMALSSDMQAFIRDEKQILYGNLCNQWVRSAMSPTPGYAEFYLIANEYVSRFGVLHLRGAFRRLLREKPAVWEQKPLGLAFRFNAIKLLLGYWLRGAKLDPSVQVELQEAMEVTLRELDSYRT